RCRRMGRGVADLARGPGIHQRRCQHQHRHDHDPVAGHPRWRSKSVHRGESAELHTHDLPDADSDMKPGAHMSAVMRRPMTGFSLVELMVALTLSLILTAGALSILYSTKLTSAENERVARIQEAARTAFELIKQDSRASGYAGFSRPH